LIVDDDEDDYYLMSDLLSQVDMPSIKIQWELSYDAALARLLHEQFDILLIDYRLGEQTGLELLRAAHELGITAPAILLTGAATPAIDREAEASGAASFILKQELTVSLLDRSIRYAMTQAHATEEVRSTGAFGYTVLDSLAAHIAVVDSDGQIVAVNQAWRDFGARNGLAPTNDGLPPNYLSVCERAANDGDQDALAVIGGLQGVLAGRLKDFSYEYPCHSPQEDRWFSVCITQLAETQPIQATIAHENISERVRAEHAVRDAEQRYRTLVEQMPALTYLCAVDKTGPPSYVGPQVASIYGYTPDEWLADATLWEDSIHPADRNRVLDEHLSTNETGEPFRVEYRIVRRDGQTRWVADNAVLVRDDSDQPSYWQGIVTDITERKQDEERRELLSNVSSVLAQSLDLPTTLQRVAQLAVPGTADWCSVCLFDDEGTLRRLAVVHGNPEKAVVAAEFQKLPIDANAAFGLPLAIRTRQPVLHTELPCEAQPTPSASEYVATQHALGMESVLNVPIVIRDRVLGGIAFVYGDSGRRYTERDIGLAEEIAQRAAVAIDNAQLYRSARKAESEFRTLVEHVPTVVYRQSLGGSSVETYLSPQIEQLLGYTIEEWQSST